MNKITTKTLTIDDKEYTLNIYYDEYSSIDDLSEILVLKMVTYHPRYIFRNDFRKITADDLTYANELIEELKETGYEHIYPIYYHEHGNIVLSLKLFSDQWDSGLLGFAYMDEKEARENIGRQDYISIEDLKNILQSEFDMYNNFIQGNIFCYNITDSSGESIDSCGSYMGDSWEDSGLVYDAISNVLWELGIKYLDTEESQEEYTKKNKLLLDQVLN